MTDLKSRSVKVSTVVGAAGVLGFGLGAKRVESLFAGLPTLRSGDWETVPAAEEVCQVDGFAEKMAERVVQCFPMMTSFIRLCAESGLQLKAPKEPASEPKKVCLSGFRDKGLEKKYNVLPSVTKECEILVCKSFEKETAKMTKAKKLGIEIVLLAEFE